jgi:hypothetical protein
MVKDPAVVAVYGTHDAAEAAVLELQRAGFDLKKLSIVGKDYHTEEHVVGYYNTGDRVKYGTEAEVARAKDILRPSAEGEPVVTSEGPASASA